MIYSLRNKVALTFIVLFMLPFLIVIVMMSEQASDIIGSSVESSALQSMDQYTTYIRNVMGQAENVGQQAISSDVLQKWTAARLSAHATEYERYRVTQSLRQYFYSLIQFNPTVASIEVYDDQGGIVGLQGDYDGEPYLSAPWYKEAQESLTWLAARADPSSGEAAGTKMNSMTLPIVYLATLQKRGVLKVDVRTDLLKEPLEKIRLGRSGAAFLVDRSGTPILGQDLTRARGLSAAELRTIAAGADGTGAPRMERSGDDGILFYRELPEVDWLLVGWVPKKDLYAKVHQTKRSLLLLAGLLFLLILPCAYWLSSGIARPLSRLARAMRYAEKGEWRTAEEATPTRLAGRTEVGYVISVFRAMLVNLQHSIQRQYELIVRQKDTELKALLLQINPHFLYNTLGVISALSARRKHDEVMDVTESLGQMLRYSLKLDSSLASLSEELLYIRRYVNIIQAFYGDDVAIEIREGPGLARVQVVKFILQPLVENAVKYSRKTGKGEAVRIEAAMEEGAVRISVSDRGTGMTPGQVARIVADADAEPDMLSNDGRQIGLRNVLARCRLYYGDSFRFRVASEENQGTTVTLFLPETKG